VACAVTRRAVRSWRFFFKDVDYVDGGAGAESHQHDLQGAWTVGVSRVAIDGDGLAIFCGALEHLVVLPIGVRDQESVPPYTADFIIGHSGGVVVRANFTWEVERVIGK